MIENRKAESISESESQTFKQYPTIVGELERPSSSSSSSSSKCTVCETFKTEAHQSRVKAKWPEKSDMDSNFHSEANLHSLCLDGDCQDYKMWHVSLDIWPHDSWKYITSVRQTDRPYRLLLGQGLPAGTESNTKTELSWCKNVLLAEDKDSVTRGPCSSDKEYVAFIKRFGE